MGFDLETFRRVLAGRKVSHRRAVIALGIGISLSILLWMMLAHAAELLDVAGRLQWRFVAAAVAVSLISYFMVGLALWEVLRLLGHRLAFPEVFGIGFVSNTANYFVSSAGISGFALKAHLLHKRGVPYGTTVTASVVSTAILYFVLAVIIAQGLAYLVLRVRGGIIQVLEGALGLAVMAAVAVPLLKFFFDRELRGRLSKKVFLWVNHCSYYFSSSEIPHEDFHRFMDQLNQGLDFIHEDRGRLTKTILYTCLDWAFCMLTLYYGFRAVGLKLGVGHLSTGFAVGQAMTLIPILPGGLGAMEASMAAVYETMRIPWESAVVAALVFRMAYYLIPGLVSVFLLWGLKMSEPELVEETVADTLPEELKVIAEELERARGPVPPETG